MLNNFCGKKGGGGKVLLNKERELSSFFVAIYICKKVLLL